jgi:hypothetical protein
MAVYCDNHTTLWCGDGWGTALQAGRSRVRFPVVLLEFRVDSASNRNEYQEYFLGIKVAGA